MANPELLQEIERLKSIIALKESENESLKEEIQNLRKSIFGKSSERRRFDSIALEQSSLFNEAENTILEEERSPELFSSNEKQKCGGRNPISPSMPREEQTLIPAEEKLSCRHCSSKLKKIGESVTEKLEIIPERIFVKKIVRPKYKCPCCELESQPNKICVLCEFDKENNFIGFLRKELPVKSRR